MSSGPGHQIILGHAQPWVSWSGEAVSRAIMPLRTGDTDCCTQCHLSIINLVKNRREAKITMSQLQIEGEKCSLECKSEMTRRKCES